MIVKLGKAIVIVAAFLIPLLPIIGIIVLLIYIVKRRRRKRAEPKVVNIPQSNNDKPDGDDQIT
ncbi:hypothetical protein D3C84_1247060 [compost metagenome]